MIINYNSLISEISYALDCVERELLGVTTNHSRRVAYIAAKMGAAGGMSGDRVVDLASCAVLHDNALTEYIHTEQNLKREGSIALHCTLGEDNIKGFPFETDVTGAVLYHHENADGSGFFRRKAADTPVLAQLIHFADILDLRCRLGDPEPDKYRKAASFLESSRGTLFASEYVDLFFSLFNEKALRDDLSNDNIRPVLREYLPKRQKDYTMPQMISIANVIAGIVDHKSPFTRRHSIGVAEKSRRMGEYYGADAETCDKLYIAGALHDIGKMAVPLSILEKPGRLSKEEYAVMKGHATYSYEILSKIEGLEEIAHWAYLHHEKLNGSGYPFGKTADELGPRERLIACLDIYQALTEDRPYKPALPHEKAMKLLNGMADNNQLDGGICADINRAFS